MVLKNFVVFHFDDKHGESRQIKYELFDHSLSARWIDILKQNEDNKNEPRSVLTNYLKNDLPTVQSEMADVLDHINTNYDRHLNTYPEIDIYDHDILNYLHYEFEMYGDRIKELQAKKAWNQELHVNFLRLNELIHIYEDIIDQNPTGNGITYMGCTWDYMPTGISGKITSEDDLFLTSDFRWGHLYLGYNTLGKDWSAVCKDNDLEVIEREEVRRQERFAAESWLYFGEEDEWAGGILAKTEFKNWYDSLPNDLKKLVPINDYSALRLGRFCIGKLIFNRAFKDFEPDETLWKIPNSNLKERWNKEVFNSFRTLTRVELLQIECQ
jgi:hypothetical protein